ncbi:hypothetical protein CR513_39585, partial [Mucuna pruriens]
MNIETLWSTHRIRILNLWPITQYYICTDFKLQNKMRKESVSIEPIRAPSSRYKKKHKQEKSYHKPYRTKEIKCWKCEKTRHYANKRRVIQKINQLEDETLKKN